MALNRGVLWNCWQFNRIKREADSRVEVKLLYATEWTDVSWNLFTERWTPFKAEWVPFEKFSKNYTHVYCHFDETAGVN